MVPSVIPQPHGFRALSALDQSAWVGPDGCWPRIKFAAVDANVLLKNISRDVRDWPRPTRMRSLMAGGMYRLFAADHVFDEVNEHLDRVITALRGNVALARTIWSREYLPYIRFVNIDVTELALLDPRTASLVLSLDPESA
jgi:hypothetical protein